MDLSTTVWRKSSLSGGNGGQCVEVAGLTGGTAVRDSKNPEGPSLLFTAAEWRTFVEGVKTGEFDRLV
ncbi:DUF397 domain-containing protein [Streptosporangium sp. NPDC001559]|uniref:DUF397 domain-containing protein n=1 Tax=Streptosporangium sp. NPDC001559 TaxID=3366187 RepID=UPI0036EC2123